VSDVMMLHDSFGLWVGLVVLSGETGDAYANESSCAARGWLFGTSLLQIAFVSAHF
jgi:hypothetical protein